MTVDATPLPVASAAEADHVHHDHLPKEAWTMALWCTARCCHRWHAFNAPAAPEPFSWAARTLGVRGPWAVRLALFDLATQIKTPTSLADLGLEAGAIEAVGNTVSAAPISNPQTLPSKISITYRGSHM